MLKAQLNQGLVTLIPVGITWLMLDFVARQLSKLGKPLLQTLYIDIRNDAPELAELLAQLWFDDLLAAMLVLLAIYALGWLISRVVGKQMFNICEVAVERLPLVKPMAP